MISCATLAMQGETECGDCCGYWETPERLIVAVADGLGHGPEAALAAQMAMACIGSALNDSIEQLFCRCDMRLQATRGVALSVVVIEKQSGLMTLASVGNIRTLLIEKEKEKEKDRRFGATRGIVGGGYGRLSSEQYTIKSGDVLALFSDGLDEFTNVRKATLSMPMPITNSTAEYAAFLLEKLANRADDAALLLYRYEGE
jgi:serine phosphatase RsbU (regulator of sigma subunit)